LAATPSKASRSRLVRKPLPEDDPKRRRPDISLARSTFDWQPTVALEEGVSRTVEYFDRLLSGARSIEHAATVARPMARTLSPA
jgi:UDP-glucuronate decarboxylase